MATNSSSSSNVVPTTSTRFETSTLLTTPITSRSTFTSSSLRVSSAPRSTTRNTSQDDSQTSSLAPNTRSQPQESSTSGGANTSTDSDAVQASSLSLSTGLLSSTSPSFTGSSELDTSSGALPTTQSLSSSTQLTAYSTSTDPSGESHTLTDLVSTPSSAAKPVGFSKNASAVAGVSVVVGIIGAALVAFLISWFLRRRRRRKREDAEFTEMEYADEYFTGAGRGVTAPGFDMEPMQPSHGHMSYSTSLSQSSMFPSRQEHDPNRAIAVPAYSNASRAELRRDFDGNDGSEHDSFDPYSGYVENTLHPANGDVAGYGAHTGGQPAISTPTPYDYEQAYAPPGLEQIPESPAQEHGLKRETVPTTLVSPLYNLFSKHDPISGRQPTAPFHNRTASGKSRIGGQLSIPSLFKAAAEDDDYFYTNGAGPSADDNSVILGRPSLGLDQNTPSEEFQTK